MEGFGIKSLNLIKGRLRFKCSRFKVQRLTSKCPHWKGSGGSSSSWKELVDISPALDTIECYFIGIFHFETNSVVASPDSIVMLIALHLLYIKILKRIFGFRDNFENKGFNPFPNSDWKFCQIFQKSLFIKAA